MNEAEIRSEIASSVETFGADSQPTIVGNITTIDIPVVVTIDASGVTGLVAQRIHIVDRGGPNEVATYGTKRYTNYVEPTVRLTNAEFFLENSAAIIASVPNAAGYELAGDLTVATQSLPVRIKNSSGEYIDAEGNVAVHGPRYLIMRVDIAPNWVLLPYNPSDSV